MTEVVAKGLFDPMNYSLTTPASGTYGCPGLADPSAYVCDVGVKHDFGYYPAGTQLVFTANHEYTSSDVVSSYYSHDAPNEWEFVTHAWIIKVIAESVPSLSTLGPAGGLENFTQCFATSKPVNCATGNFTHTFTDLAVPGRGEQLDLTRTYNSLVASSEGMFGYGWTSSYETSLSFDSGGNATVHEAGGAQIPFSVDSNGNFQGGPQVLGSLVKNSDGTYTLTQRARESFKFSSTGQLLSESDLNGNTTTLAYDGSGRLSTVTDPAGRTLSYSYGSNGLVSSVTDSAGRTVSYGYDGSGNLTSATAANLGVWTFGYDGNHLLTSMTDPRNDGSVTNTYDGQGRVTQQVDQMGRTTKFDYGASSTTITSPNGNQTLENYQGGMLASLTKGYGTPSAATWTYTYDQTLGLSSVTDPNGHTWSATYDDSGNRTGTTDPLGNKTSATYNSFDEPTTVTDANGVTTSYGYDSNGNLTSISRPLTSTGQTRTTNYAYGDAANPGLPTSITDPNNNKWTLAYDSYGQLTSSTDPTGDQTTYSYTCSGGASAGCYPNIGLLYSQVSPRGNVSGATAASFTTSYAYDALGDKTSMTDPLGHQTTYKYDADANQTSVTDPDNHTTTYTYDADNELTQVTRPDSTTLQSGYDANGNLISQTNGAKNQTTYAYDPLNRLISVTDPLNRTTSYTYDGAGNQLTLTDPEGRTSTYGYDNANQRTSITYSDGSTPNATYTYDNNGQRASMSDGTGTTSYVYDSLDRLTSEKNGAGQQVSYGYDLAGDATSITYPNGQVVTRTFDASGRLTSVADGSGGTTSFTYDPDSNLTQTNMPQTMDSFVYNDADQMTSEQLAQGTTKPASLTYTRDADGLVTSEAQTGLSGPATTTTAYTYTPLNQLATAGTQNYSYDKADNPTQLAGSSGYTYDAANQLTSSPAGSYSYDQLGERTRLTPSSGSPTSYSYDQAGRLTKFTAANGTSTTYSYNADGLRASKTTPGTPTSNFAWDQSSDIPLLLTDGQNNFIYGPNDLPIEQTTSGGKPTYLHHDQLGSTRLTTQSRNTVGSYSYTPYGAPAAINGGAPPLLGYAGQYTDPNTGLVYLRARYYDPTTGQFLTPDPLEQLTRQPYGYADDNPTNDVDPTGLIDAMTPLAGGDGSESAAQPWNCGVGILGSGAGLPTGGSFPYNSGQKGGAPIKLPGSQGYRDKNGNRWVWDPQKGEWDVQHPDRSHTNIGPNGEITHGPDNFPSQPKAPGASSSGGGPSTIEKVVGGSVIVAGGLLLAGETGGASLIPIFGL